MSETAVSQIRLRRSPGMGGSPCYELAMNADGSATYVGMGFVEMTGAHRGRVDAGAFQALGREAERLAFFSMDAVPVAANLPSRLRYDDRARWPGKARHQRGGRWASPARGARATHRRTRRDHRLGARPLRSGYLSWQSDCLYGAAGR